MIPLTDFEKAAGMLKGSIIRTPLVYSPAFSRMTGAEVYLKLENLQKTGSFKLRGATYKLLLHKNDIAENGVVAASAGNHAQGVALAARLTGVPATIVMPEWVSISKQQATRDYGGEVLIHGKSVEDSLKKAQELTKDDRTFIHPFDDMDVIRGQGTVALEIFDELPETDLIIVPVGGGGLISGIAAASRSLKPSARIIGVQSENCPSASRALTSGRIVAVEAKPSIADGISVKRTGSTTLEIMRESVDEILLVGEGDTARAILMLLERKKVLAEGAGAVSLAAIIGGQLRIPAGSRVVLVISGGNVDSPLLDRIINQGMVRSGRILRLWVYLEDKPGVLSRLLSRISGLQANVLNIHHERGSKTLPLYMTRVEMELETRSQSHIDTIVQELAAKGYRIEIKS